MISSSPANADTGISVDSTCQSAEIGANAYQNNVQNTLGIPLSQTALVLVPGEPLFVDAEDGNFYLAAGSRVIDSSISCMQAGA